MVVLAQPRDWQQRQDALVHANEIRHQRRELKDALRAGEIRIEDVLREPEWFVFTVPVCELLLWAPRVGPARVNMFLRRAEIWPLREAGRLTLRQRMRLLAVMSATPGRES